jgi:deoxyribonuclease-4
MEEMLRVGLHTSIAGSLEASAEEAARLGANTFQIFSASPRQWRAAMPSAAAIRRFRAAREKHALTPLVVHDNYLINLAANNPEIREKSIAAFRGELERAIALGADYLVAHPGNAKGQSIEQGILAFLDGVAKAAEGLEYGHLMLLIENTAGGGAQLGSKFEELRAMREFAPQFTALPVGFCLDTCHLLAAGYNVATEDGLRQTLAEARRLLGLDNVRIIHANDSKGALGSRLDRHQNIGAGHIGLEGFRRIVNHPQLRGKPFILETPREKPGDDRRNLETLKSLYVARA